MYFTTIKHSSRVYFLTKFVKLDPDPHSFYLLDPDPYPEKLLAGSGSAKNDCGTTALLLSGLEKRIQHT